MNDNVLKNEEEETHIMRNYSVMYYFPLLGMGIFGMKLFTTVHFGFSLHVRTVNMSRLQLMVRQEVCVQQGVTAL